MTRRVASARLTGPLVMSAALHLAAASLFLLTRSGGGAVLPPMYRVELIAAPPGAPAIGEVTNAPPEATPAKATPRTVPKPADDAIKLKKLDTKAASKASKVTPVPTKAKAAAAPLPRAGGGEVGGPGTDVANVRTEGIDFPFPGYLQNIVRQIRLNFSPSDRSARTAEVFFLVRRDGTVSGFRFLQRSGSYAFDLEAQGAVEAAARTKAFGPLPAGFFDDVLPVIFRFDPKTLR
ncbi:MAG: TonB C-terminal domain-containing protein [Gemmatimonadaceae bacterium]